MANLSAKRLARLHGRSPGTLAALDIGCAKTTCLIAREDPAGGGTPAILGGGRQQTRGYSGGNLTDMDGLERTIRLAVEDAERDARTQISDVIVGISGPQVTSQIVSASLDIGGRVITARDIRRLHLQAVSRLAQRQTELIGAWPVAYSIDRAAGRIRQPLGMVAGTLSVKIAAVTAPRIVLRNLVECIGRAHLGIDRIVPAAIASGAGTLIEDEIENGAVCIDMGSGTTSVSVFLNGAPAWLGLVPAGGAHVTSDIAQGLHTTFAVAERLKVMHGVATLDGPSLGERLEAARIGDDGRLQASRITRGDLARIIAPRIEEIFELVQTVLAASDVRQVLPHRFVLTGGASQLLGVRDAAQRVLGAPVRLGRPVMAESLGEQLATPAFSTASGLLTMNAVGFTEAVQLGAASMEKDAETRPGWLNGMLQWLKENF